MLFYRGICFSILITSLFSLGCTPQKDAEPPQNLNNPGLSLPLAVQKALIAPENLFAYAKVDDNPWQTMLIANNQASIEFAGLSLGLHQFTIKYEFQSQGLGSLVLAQATADLDIQVGSQQLTLLDSNYNYNAVSVAVEKTTELDYIHRFI